jgi:cytochrome c553
MKKVALVSLLSALTLAGPALAGDPVAGKDKATACIACHGSESFGGVFYTLQLAGRDADKLTIKTNKYKTGKILHPVMNLAVSFFTEKEIEDISAYYQSLGKPAVTSPYFTIKGDDDASANRASAPMAAPAGSNWVAKGY